MATYRWNKYNVASQWGPPVWSSLGVTEQRFSGFYKNATWNSSYKMYQLSNLWADWEMVPTGAFCYYSSAGLIHRFKATSSNYSNYSIASEHDSADPANSPLIDTQGSYIGQVTSTSRGTYPDNGKHSDGYWYVYVGIDDTPPTTPSSISVSGTLVQGQTITISWGASTDAEGDLITYYLEVSINGGAFTNVISGTTARSRNYTIPTTVTTLVFRVRSFANSKYSSYRTSNTFSVSQPNTIPIVLLKDMLNEQITHNQILKAVEKSDFTFKITPNDLDSADAILYQVLLRNVVRTDWTSVNKGIEFEYSIPYTELLLGNNLITVKVTDNNGAEVTINFILANSAPSTLSQRTVLDVLIALGYENAGDGSLNVLKPAGYSRPTISLQEIINSL